MRINRCQSGFVVAALACISLLGTACGDTGGNSGSSPSSQDVGSGSLTGAGSTFVKPLFDRAFYQYSQEHASVTVNYQAVGSGAGIQQFSSNLVDFGASDVPMKSTEIAAAGGDSSLIQIPDTVGAVAVGYNLPGVDGLKLDGTALSDIFLGKVKKWNDPEIASLNGGASLPATDITVVHRSDGSGTSYIFTDYLSKVSPDWASKVGKGKSVQWPAGVGAKGNSGVGSQIKQTQGAIGYVELAYVVQTGLQSASLKNSAGSFVKPSVAGAAAAAAHASSPSPTSFSIVNESGSDSYPIVGYSWVFIRTSISDANKGKALVHLMDWLVTTGQQYGKDLQYAPLSGSARDYAISQLKTVKANGSTVLS